MSNGKKGSINLANKVSITRIILIPFFIAAVVYSKMEIALILFIIAIISDGVDGFVARTFNQKTALGTILDPIADKLLLVSAYLCLTFATNIPAGFKLPPYVLIVVISRDVFIIMGSLVVYLMRGDLKVAPSIIGKITTFFQMITIVAILIRFPFTSIVWNLTAILTIFSGIDYMIKGGRLLSENNLAGKKVG